ncbi:uncharacterized protein MELLADRAFT_92211 [Melampsora larici-populina 98AG31]|uniref:Uncharacterized protein n=1 Tax=Melampsora larici-populina (strain 98AG31 / pathotype 3-4-7) TaxID=747676 RepID=F4R8T4_MELLP|nr:uncharacterized protein MELLADRAFT_92211 [Melampsora larici-populina 98AG31]EGG10864.1 hypothetical protein MELLADRAFT_92211 [Melampsora larici-populina 98AG31]
MPLSSKLNLEVGCKTWRFNHEDQSTAGGPPKRGGQFQSPSRPRPTARQSLSHDRQPPPDATVVSDPRPTSEQKRAPSETSRREREAMEAEKARIEEMAHRAAAEQQRIEEMAQRAAAEQQRIEEMAQAACLEKNRLEEMRQRAAEEEAFRLEQQQLIDDEKKRMLYEADQRLQQLREQVAAVEEKHRAELAHWEERERRATLLEIEAEARAKARDEAEEAKALERNRALELERVAGIERARNDAIEQYRRVQEEVRRTQDEARRVQEEELRKELDEARKKFAEEKAALEADHQAKMAQIKEMQLESQKTGEDLKEQMATFNGCSWLLTFSSHLANITFILLARNLKLQELQVMRNISSVAGGGYLSSDPSVTKSAPAAANTISLDGPIPDDLPPADREKWVRHRRENLKRTIMEGVGLTHGQSHPDEWRPSGRLPGRVIGLSSTSQWGTPAPRYPTNSTGHNALRTPFVPGSSVMHLEPSHRMGPVHQTSQYPKHSSSGGASAMAGTPYLNYGPPPGSSMGWGAPHGRSARSAAGNLRPYGNPGVSEPNGPRHYSASGQGQQPEEDNEQFCVVFTYLYICAVLTDSFSRATLTVQVIPGFEYERIFGEVFGSTLRDIPNIPPAHQMTVEAQQILRESAMIQRRLAVNDLIQRAKVMGANGAIGLGFHTNPISQTCCEVVATATAVRLVACDKMAVLPSNVEHATRIAHENERSGYQPPNAGMNGKQNDQDGQKKKNKGKGKNGGENQSSTDQDQSESTHDRTQNEGGKNKKGNKQQQKQSKNNDNADSGWGNTNTNADSNDWNSNAWGCGDMGDSNANDDCEEESSQQDAWGSSWQDNQGKGGGQKGGEKNMSKKEKKNQARASQNQQVDEDRGRNGGNGGGGGTWDEPDQGWGNNNAGNSNGRNNGKNNNSNNYNNGNNNNSNSWNNSNNSNSNGYDNGNNSNWNERNDEACNQRSDMKRQQNSSGDGDWNAESSQSNNNSQQWNDNRNQKQGNKNYDSSCNSQSGSGQRNNNNNKNNNNNNNNNNDGQQRNGKSNQNWNGNQSNCRNQNNGNGNSQQDDGDGDAWGTNNSWGGNNNQKTNGQDSWQQNECDNEDSNGKKKDKQNQEGKKGKAGKGAPSQAEIARRKEEAQRNKANNDKNGQKQNKKGKQPPPPPEDDDDDDDDADDGMMGGAFEFANYQPSILYPTYALVWLTALAGIKASHSIIHAKNLVTHFYSRGTCS